MSKNRTKEENSRAVQKFRLKKLGMSLDEWEKMNEDQKGLCKICGKPASGRFKRLATDHSHVTGKVRGLLCQFCNVALGWLEKNEVAVKKYLGH